MTSIPSLKKLAAITPNINAYSAAGEQKKDAMHSSGRAFMRRLADDLNIPKEHRDIRSNQAGIAVSGEVTLHTDHLYVQLSESCIGSGAVSVLYRSCKDRKDYTGGHNNFTSAGKLAEDNEYARFLVHCQTLIVNAAAVAHAKTPKP